MHHQLLSLYNHTESVLSSPPGKLNFIDHLVGNQGNNQMADVVKNYEANLQFHRFWSIDDDLVSS
jgi:4-hydroxyphenylpyruvate dioxygenase